MFSILLAIQILVSVSIITLVLLQQGKGAEAGASFGAGASQTVFGSQGSGNFFSRLTAIMATVFFVTSFGLAILASNKNEANVDADLPSIPAVIEQRGEAPIILQPSAALNFGVVTANATQVDIHRDSR